MNANTTLLVQGDVAAREIRSAVREQIDAAMREVAGPVRDLYELLSDQRGVLTLARCADLLGVSARTVTETYVARRGLPCVRLGQNSAPLFLLDEVISWLKTQDVSERGGGSP
jgi:hypothetical protein